ncbi:Vacuolar protein sorting-associated protein 33A [Physocladia obscura]|uniref:Vacuolar protein sorting-associated protein 33A n=1 Tax=Physocladia obscura TaxID=109957 RepID=A0AAD5SMF0_9FUNG|nr:Vacuolar protein sorting-associated protein 33A [Physocladia obscura]
MIDKQAPILQTLRLMCLYSVVCGGIKAKTYDLLRREFVQTYGIEHLITLQNLESVGLLSSSTQSSGFEPSSLLSAAPTALTGGGTSSISIGGGASATTPFLSSATTTAAAAAAAAAAVRVPFANTRKALSVIVDDIDEQNPMDVAYVHSGYAPVSIRLIEAATGVGKFRSSGGGGTNGKKNDVGASGGTSDGSGANPAGGSVRGGGGGGGSSAGKRKVGWEGMEEILKAVPGGESFEIQQELPDPDFVLS